MKPAIVVSQEDKAGMAIRDVLVSLHGFQDAGTTFQGTTIYSKEGINLYTLSTPTIEADGIDSELDCDCIIFATRHKAESKKKCFCVHVPGNWDAAEAGGAPRNLCYALPGMMKDALKKLRNIYTGDEFDVTMEATHHGPAITKPCMFIEIGSSEEEWVREDCARVIANVVNYIVMNPIHRYKEVIVLGGLHYNQVANKLMFSTELAVGHVCPKYALPKLTKDLLRQAIDRNGERFKMLVIDWKGLGAEKEHVMKTVEELGVAYERYQRIVKED